MVRQVCGGSDRVYVSMCHVSMCHVSQSTWNGRHFSTLSPVHIRRYEKYRYIENCAVLLANAAPSTRGSGCSTSTPKTEKKMRLAVQEPKSTTKTPTKNAASGPPISVPITTIITASSRYDMFAVALNESGAKPPGSEVFVIFRNSSLRSETGSFRTSVG